MESITLHYSEELIRRAVKAFWWRTTGWRYFAGLALLLVWVGGALWGGSRSWWVGTCGAISSLAVIFAVVLYGVHYRSSLTRFRRMRSPEATLELGDERFRVSSDVGSSELAWSTVAELWQFPDFRLLFLSPAQFITLPTADLDPAAREFLATKLKVQGAKVA